MGTSSTNGLLAAWNTDHPHACGDKTVCKAILALFAGSSPRVWGQVSLCATTCRTRRIIPTRVGTRSHAEAVKRPSLDHPHACGDKRHKDSSFHKHKGSSPRVWGQVVFVAVAVNLAGIIPTRVGTSKGRKDTAICHRDHPHACGDKLPP